METKTKKIVLLCFGLLILTLIVFFCPANSQTKVTLHTITTERNDTTGAVSGYSFKWRIDTVGGLEWTTALKAPDSILTVKQRLVKAFTALKIQFRSWVIDRKREEYLRWKESQRNQVLRLDTTIIIN